jgi:hypothetical protein
VASLDDEPPERATNAAAGPPGTGSKGANMRDREISDAEPWDAEQSGEEGGQDNVIGPIQAAINRENDPPA